LLTWIHVDSDDMAYPLTCHVVVHPCVIDIHPCIIDIHLCIIDIHLCIIDIHNVHKSGSVRFFAPKMGNYGPQLV